MAASRGGADNAQFVAGGSAAPVLSSQEAHWEWGVASGWQRFLPASRRGLILTAGTRLAICGLAFALKRDAKTAKIDRSVKV
jgi:hypothetical protein